MVDMIDVVRIELEVDEDDETVIYNDEMDEPLEISFVVPLCIRRVEFDIDEIDEIV